MLSLEPELTTLRDSGAIDDATAARLIAIERREVVSVYPELRLLTWAGVMLISWGVGLFISKHLDDIGPLAIAAGIGIAAVACYAWSFFKRARQAALADDYILLLAALLAYVPASQVLLGSDYPFSSIGVSVKGLEDVTLPAETLDAIYGGNAARLMPRLGV